MKDDNQKVHDIESRVADEQFRQALRETTVGGWFRVSAEGANARGREVRRELCRVAVPPDRACGWVVTLGTPDYGGAGKLLDDPDLAYALIEWGNGGVQTFAEIDWRVGCVVPVFGSFVTVTAIVPAESDENCTALQNLRAFIAPGTYKPHFAPTVTRYIGDVAATALVHVAVPPFARRLWASMYNATVYNATYGIRFRYANRNTYIARHATAASPNSEWMRIAMQHPLNIPPKATDIGYQNNDAVAHAQVAITFELAL